MITFKCGTEIANIKNLHSARFKKDGEELIWRLKETNRGYQMYSWDGEHLPATSLDFKSFSLVRY